jgi:class I fructose-bisphosphate aldolase
MDHGVTMGPIIGIAEIEQTIEALSTLCIDGIILHKGIINAACKTIIGSDLPLIMHLSASTLLGDQSTKVLVGDVSEAVSFGCSAVSIHINFGVPNESAMLRDLAIVSEKCYKYGMPLLAMAYHEKCDIDTICHIARVCAELGADLVKVPFTKDDGDFTKVILGCPVPILISGGTIDTNIVNTVIKAMSCGATGVAIGRNIFQSNNMLQTIKEIIKIVR